MLEQKNVTVKAGNSFQTVCPFPVGYIYQSYNSTSPANIYGGSWTPITGRFLYCNSGTGVGGSNTHTLTIAEMPAHTHPQNVTSNIVAGYGQRMDWSGDGRCSPYPQGIDTTSTGGNQAHNNMPAYQTCYAWRRTN